MTAVPLRRVPEPLKPTGNKRLSGLGRITRGLWKHVSGSAQKLFQPHKASLKRLAEIPLTVAAVVCIDFAAFHYVHMIGWVVTGLSLLYLERAIADEE